MRFRHFALSVSAASALIAGCGGLQPPIREPGVMMPQTHSFTAHSDRNGSWMAPAAAKDDLLYITNRDTVTVYSYPDANHHVGTLKGFSEPQAECVDKAGDVFIGDGDTFREYAHAGTKVKQTLTFSGYLAGGCSSDPTTGNLAIAWVQGFYGYVAVYKNGTGEPTLYQHANMSFAYCGYDAAGNLFVDGITYASGQVQLAELVKNGSGLATVTLNQLMEYPGPVQWDGKYLAVGDNSQETVYQFAISSLKGTREGTTTLKDGQNISQWWIEGYRLIGSSGISPYITSYWRYPAGRLKKTFLLKGVTMPYGAAVSKAK